MVRARRSARSCARARVHASARDRTRRGWACARTGFPAAGARTMKGLLGETAVDLTGVAPVLAAPSPRASESFTTGLGPALASAGPTPGSSLGPAFCTDAGALWFERDGVHGVVDAAERTEVCVTVRVVVWRHVYGLYRGWRADDGRAPRRGWG